MWSVVCTVNRMRKMEFSWPYDCTHSGACNVISVARTINWIASNDDEMWWRNNPFLDRDRTPKHQAIRHHNYHLSPDKKGELYNKKGCLFRRPCNSKLLIIKRGKHRFLQPKHDGISKSRTLSRTQQEEDLTGELICHAHPSDSIWGDLHNNLSLSLHVCQGEGRIFMNFFHLFSLLPSSDLVPFLCHAVSVSIGC